MEALILAAGKGTRLGAITDHTPKCLVDIHGTTMLEMAIKKLISANCSKIVINLHHLADKVIAFLKEKKFFNHNIELSHEPELYNTGGGLKFAEKLFSKQSPIVIYNADIYCDIDLKKLTEFHTSNTNHIATLVTRDPQENRVLTFNTDGLLAGWKNLETTEEKTAGTIQPDTTRGFCGIHCVSPEIFSLIEKPSEKESIITSYLRALDTGKTIREYPLKNQTWFDIGTPRELERLRKFIQE